MSDLVRYYRQYYREQTTDAFDSLFACMLDYDFSSYHDDMKRVYAMWREAKCAGDVFKLKSGGSTSGVPGAYYFGPNFKHVRFAIEGFLRMSHNKTILIGGAPGLDVVLYREENNWPQFDMQVMCDWNNATSVEKFFALFESIFSSWGPLNLVALPALWLSLTYDPVFLDWANNNTSKIGALVNTDSTKCFNKTACRTRDQMMDWGSGVNFYTCELGLYHFLPTFFCSSDDCANLVNLKRSARSVDDLISLDEEVVLCGCGRPTLRMRFIPHKHNFPVDESGRFVDLDGMYEFIPPLIESLQIYQEPGGESEVFYSFRGGDLDLLGLLNHLESVGFGKSTVAKDRYFSVGNKSPLVWRGGNPSFKTRRRLCP